MTTGSQLWTSAWVGSIVGSVGVGLIPGDDIGESLCGVWGCLPPAQALLSLHLLWLFLLAPPAVVLARFRPRKLATRIGLLLILAGVLVVAGVIADGIVDWGFPTSDPEYGRYAIRRALYSLATRTEIPAIQLLITGISVVIAARRQTRMEDCPR